MRFPPFLMKCLSVLVQPTTPQAQGISGQLIQFPLFCLIQLFWCRQQSKQKKHRAFTDFKSFLYLGDPSGKCTISSSDSPSPGNPAYPQKVQLSGIFSFKKWHPSSSARPPRKYPELLCQQSIKSSTKVWNTEITGSKAFCWYLEFSV